KEVAVTFAVRVMTKRGKGIVGFTHVQDSTGQIQLYVRIDEIGEEAYEIFKTVDIGDIVSVSGLVFKTKVVELSIHVNEFIILSSGYRITLPEKLLRFNYE